jgi:Phosphatidyl serine synthase
MEPDHPFVIARLAGVFLCALPASRELYQYINDPRYGQRISLFSVLRFFDLSNISESSDIFYAILRSAGKQLEWGNTFG